MIEKRDELPELEESFVPVLNLVPVALIITRLRDGIFIEANDACLTLLNRRRDQIIGRKGVEVGIFATEVMRNRFVEILHEQTGVRGSELTIVRSDGEARNVLLSMAKINYRGEECILKSLTDITERRAAESALELMNQQLEQRVAMRTEELESFSYSVSHDLRTPVRHLSGFLELFRNSLASRADVALTETELRYLSYLDMSSSRLDRLIEKLLILHRIGRREIKKEAVELAEVVQQAIAELSAVAATRNIEWDIGRLSTVHADPALILSVFENLIGNALKFSASRDPARIQIGEDLREGRTHVYIRDNGVGFDMRFAGKLFGVFQRLHTESEFEGTGIGLAIVKRIMDHHGGSVFAEGSVGKGATFHLILPAVGEA